MPATSAFFAAVRQLFGGSLSQPQVDGINAIMDAWNPTPSQGDATMPAKVWPLQSDAAAMNKLYGNPDANGDGAPDPQWAAKWLTTIVPPYQMYYDGKPIKRITVNKGCADALLTALKGIRDLYGSQSAIEAAGLHKFGGVYNFRPIRGGKALSTHARACGIDLNPEKNAQGTAGVMSPSVVAIFEATGATWGGRWSGKSKDPMHFQWARLK